MKQENEKYKKVLELLKRSQPQLESPEEIEREVIKRLSGVRSLRSRISEVIDFIFGWVYITWIRRSLITASVAMVVIFIYQQGIILKRIDYLSRHTINNEREYKPLQTDEVEKKLLNYMNSGRRFPSKTITISEKQLKDLIESVNELQIKYKDLEKLLENDPEIRRIVEKKLIEENNTKTKL